MYNAIIALILAGVFTFLLIIPRKSNNFLQHSIRTTPTTAVNVISKAQVPLPSEEDIIRVFFELIKEKRIPEAISMMDQESVKDEATKQQWAVQLNNLIYPVVKNIKPSMKEDWTKNEETFQVNINLEVAKDAANAPIPYFGWENGDNIRFITLRKNAQNIWKIVGIATGP
jgi:hypothetical protein